MNTKLDFRNNYAVLFSVGLLIAVCLFPISNIIQNLGHHIQNMGKDIPDETMSIDYFTGVIFAFCLGVSIFFWPVSAKHRKWLLSAWLAKCFVVLGVMLFYENNYGLDAYAYFYHPINEGDPAFKAYDGNAFVLGDGTNNILYLIKLYYKVFPVSYHGLKVCFSYFGLIGVYIFYKAVIVYSESDNKKLFFCFAFFPSILFWSSILGKDPVNLFVMSLYIYGVVGWYKFRSPRYFITLAASIFFVFYVRTWLAAIMISSLALLFIFTSTNRYAKILLVIFCIFMFFVFSDYVKETFFSTLKVDSIVEIAHFYGQNLEEAGSTKRFEFYSINDMLIFYPYGLFTALFRPLPGEVMNVFGLLAGIENLFLISLLYLSFKRSNIRELNDPLVLWAISIILFWSLIYAFISPLNPGAAVRYRLQILPLLLGLLLLFSRKRPSELICDSQKFL